jgi:hypothetical protein
MLGLHSQNPKEKNMHKNNALEVADSASFAIGQQPVRPVLRLAYGKRDGSLPNPNLSRLNRKEEHYCNRTTD